MTLRHPVAALLAWTFLAVPAFAAAPDAPAPAPAAAAALATFADHLGAIPVMLPVPAGFGAPSATPKAVSDLIVRNMPAEYRVIGLLLTPRDLARFAAHGDLKDGMARYAILVTDRRYEDDGMPAASFARLKALVHQQGSEFLKATEATVARIGDGLAKDIATSSGDPAIAVDAGQSMLLGVFDEGADSIALATTASVALTDSAGTERFEQVTAIGVVRVHGRPVSFQVYAEYRTQADVDWAEGQVRDFIQRIARLNSASPTP